MTCKTGDRPTAAMAREIAPRSRRSVYPEPFAALMDRREKRALGDFFGLTNFGVNLTTIAPGGQSALLHRHSPTLFPLEEHGWECRSCQRAFSVRFLGLRPARGQGKPQP